MTDAYDIIVDAPISPAYPISTLLTQYNQIHLLWDFPDAIPALSFIDLLLDYALISYYDQNNDTTINSSISNQLSINNIVLSLSQYNTILNDIYSTDESERMFSIFLDSHLIIYSKVCGYNVLWNTEATIDSDSDIEYILNSLYKSAYILVYKTFNQNVYLRKLFNYYYSMSYYILDSNIVVDSHRGLLPYGRKQSIYFADTFSCNTRVKTNGN